MPLPEYEFELYQEEGEIYAEAWDIMRSGGVKIPPSLEGFKHLMELHGYSPPGLARLLCRES